MQKIRCLVCKNEMSIEHRQKHNQQKHSDLIAAKKTIKFEIIGAVQNPFTASAGIKLKRISDPCSSSLQNTDDTKECRNETPLATLSSAASNTKSPSHLSPTSKRARIDVESLNQCNYDDDSCSAVFSATRAAVEEVHLTNAQQKLDDFLTSTCTNNSSKSSKSTKTTEEDDFSVLVAYAAEVNEKILQFVSNVSDQGSSVKSKYSCVTNNKLSFFGYMAAVKEFLNFIANGTSNIVSFCDKIDEIMQKVNSKKNTSNLNDEPKELLPRDPGLRHNTKLNKNEKQYLLSQGPCQPLMSNYLVDPHINKRKQNSFSSKWYAEYPYLEYSVAKDAAYCFACCLCSDVAGSKGNDSAWIDEGVRSWHKFKSRGKCKEGKLKQHFTGESHKAAILHLDYLKNKFSQVDVLISETRRRAVLHDEQLQLENREIIKVFIDCARYLGRQSLAFRGANDDQNGNFKQLVALLSRWVVPLQIWINNVINRPYSVTYCSNRSQNEYIQLLGSSVRDKIVLEIQKCKQFSLMIDTTPDLSHLDQVCLIIRFVDDQFTVEERLVAIRAVVDKTGNGLADTVLNLLNELQLSPLNLRAQSYDTTASMSGKYKGLQAKISEKLDRTVIYIPCLAHKTNLAVEHACDSSTDVMSFFETIQQLYVFFTSSTKRFELYASEVGELETSLSLKSLSKTRWSMRADSIRAVLACYDKVIDVLMAISENVSIDNESRVQAGVLNTRLKSYDFVICLLFMKDVMFKTNNAIQQLQKQTIDILSCMHILNSTADAILRMRQNDLYFSEIITSADKICINHNVDPNYEYQKRHRPRKMPTRFDENASTSYHTSRDQFYKMQMINVLDRLNADISELHESVFKQVTPLAYLTSAKIGTITREIANDICNLFPLDLKDVDVLLNEIDLFQSLLQKRCAPNIAESAKQLIGIEHLYPQLALAYKCALLIPTTVATNERTFSKLKHIKNYLRTTMSENRLDDVMLLSCESDILDVINIEALATGWSLLKNRRIAI